jgi:hypothetical protein
MRLYELAVKLRSLDDTLSNLEDVHIPEEISKEYLELLEEATKTEEEFKDKVDSILGLIHSRKKWAEIRKEEAKRLSVLSKKDENSVAFLSKYLKQHLESLNKTKLRTKHFNVSIGKASTAPLNLKVENVNSYPEKYKKVTIEINKKLLKEDVIKGDPEALKFASLGEKTTYLLIL